MASLKGKYNRVAADNSQLQQFVDELCEGGALEIPASSAKDSGKVLTVNEDGEYVLGDAGGGSSEKTIVSISIGYSDLDLTSGVSVIATQAIVEQIAEVMELARGESIQDLEVIIHYPAVTGAEYRKIFPIKQIAPLSYKYEDHTDGESPYTSEYLYAVYEGGTDINAALSMNMVGFYLDSTNKAILLALGEKMTQQAKGVLLQAIAVEPMEIIISYREKEQK